MTPIWKIRSGRFAGWHSTDAVYDAAGLHVGYLAGHYAYALDGGVLGELFQGEWIGRRANADYSPGESHPRGESVAHERLPDRTGLEFDGWADPEM